MIEGCATGIRQIERVLVRKITGKRSECVVDKVESRDTEHNVLASLDREGLLRAQVSIEVSRTFEIGILIRPVLQEVRRAKAVAIDELALAQA